MQYNKITFIRKELNKKESIHKINFMKMDLHFQNAT